MPKLDSQPERLSNLRQRAVSHLTTGVPAHVARTPPSQALAVLHAMASSPATAADALALLHELQVHQVELELQHEELRTSSAELEAALQRQSMLYDHAPVAYLTLAAGAVVCELNLAAAHLLGQTRDELVGQSLRNILSPAQADTLLTLIEGAGCSQPGQTRQTCHLPLKIGAGAPRKLLACASADTVPGRCLVVLVELDDPGAAPAA